MKYTIAILGLFFASMASAGTCPTFVATGAGYVDNIAGVTSCFYIDAVGGLDTNSGATELLAWQHAPTMANATSTSAAHTPSAGEGWIFKGGVTNGSASFPMNPPYGGTSSQPTYMGTDRTWFTGGSWSRPIFDGGGSTGYNTCSQGFITDVAHQANFVIYDSLEFTGLYWNCTVTNLYGASYISTGTFTGSHGWEAINVYGHGWSHGTSAGDPGNTSRFFEMSENPTAANRASFHDSVVDGSDGTKDCCNAASAYNFYNNYVAWVDNMWFSGGGASEALLFHDNFFTNQTGSSTPVSTGVHSNCFHTFSATSGFVLEYNNYINCGVVGKPTDTEAQASLYESNSTTNYVFNNFIVSGHPEPISMKGNDNGNVQTFFQFNNTVQAAQTDVQTNSCIAISFDTIATVADDFCITNSNNGPIITERAPFTGSITTPSPTFSLFCAGGWNGVAQSNFGASQICAPIGAGNGTGNLNITQSPYPYFPADSTANASIGTGQNNTSFCTSVAALNAAAGVACQSDTTLGVAYNATNHTVSWPNRTPVARPSSGTNNWTNGMFQFATPGTATPAPATGMFATLTVNPLPAQTVAPVPTLTKSAPVNTYLTSKGFSQDGITFVASLPFTFTGTNLNIGAASCTLDGTTIPCTCSSSTQCVATLTASKLAIPTKATAHTIGLSVASPASAPIPVLQ